MNRAEKKEQKLVIIKKAFSTLLISMTFVENINKIWSPDKPSIISEDLKNIYIEIIDECDKNWFADMTKITFLIHAAEAIMKSIPPTEHKEFESGGIILKGDKADNEIVINKLND